MTTSWKRLNLLASEPTQATPNDIRSMAHDLIRQRRAAKDAALMRAESEQLRQLQAVERRLQIAEALGEAEAGVAAALEVGR